MNLPDFGSSQKLVISIQTLGYSRALNLAIFLFFNDLRDLKSHPELESKGFQRPLILPILFGILKSSFLGT
jgi:hypothetical protein